MPKLRKLLLPVLAMFVSMAAVAQVTTSSISGTVKDKGGNALEGATITATHTPTGTVYQTLSKKGGVFTIPNARIGGPYKLTVVFVGQKTYEVEGFNLSLGEPYDLKVEMGDDVKQITEVVVTGGKRRGTVEKTGHNDGAKVEYIIHRGGGAKGSPYCAYFVTLCIDSAKVKEPKVRTGLARNFKLKSSIKASDVLSGKSIVPKGTILVWEKGNTINGHTGFVLDWIKDKGFTIEANTSSGNSGSQSDGGGIYIRERKIEPMNYFRITSFTLVKY